MTPVPRPITVIAIAIACAPMLGGCGGVATDGSGETARSKIAITADARPDADLPVVFSQPVNQSATAGDPVTFAVEARCPAGRLQVQWQQLDGADFIDIAKAVREHLTFDTSTEDSGARFRAWLSCDGKSEVITRIVALTVPAPTPASALIP